MVQAQQLLEDSIRLSGDRIIYGTKFFPKLIVNGSLDVDTIKVNRKYTSVIISSESYSFFYVNGDTDGIGVLQFFCCFGCYIHVRDI